MLRWRPHAMNTHEALRILDLTAPIDGAILTGTYELAAQVWQPERLEGNEALQARAAAKVDHLNAAYRWLSELPQDEFPYRAAAAATDLPQQPPAPSLSPHKKEAGTLALTAWGMMSAVGGVVLLALFATVFSSCKPQGGTAAAPSLVNDTSGPNLAEMRARAEQGDAEAQHSLGVCYSEGRGIAQDHNAAALWFGKAAVQGHASAALALGHVYRTGTGAPKNEVNATDWYLRAAQHGNATAQYIIAGRYYFGEGISADPAQSWEWYRKAAAQGHAAAQNNLGAMLYTGKGDDLNPTEGMKWFILAAEQGDKDAINWIAQARKELTPQQLADAEHQAAEFRNSHPAKAVKETKSPPAAVVPDATPATPPAEPSKKSE